MEREFRVNLLSLAGVVIAVISFTIMPALSFVEISSSETSETEYTMADVFAGGVPGRFLVYSEIFLVIILLGVIVSSVTPLGGFLVLFGSLSVQYRFAYINSSTKYTVVNVTEPGTYMLIVASLIILEGIFVRVAIVGRSLRLEHGLDGIIYGLLTVSYLRPSHVQVPKRGMHRRPNPVCLAGIALGLAALVFPWWPRTFPGDAVSGLDVLFGYAPSRIAFQLQVIVVLYVMSTLLSLLSPIAGTVQLTCALSYLMSTEMLYQGAVWLSIVSSLIIIHSLLMPWRDAQGGPRLAIVENLRTFRQI